MIWACAQFETEKFKPTTTTTPALPQGSEQCQQCCFLFSDSGCHAQCLLNKTHSSQESGCLLSVLHWLWTGLYLPSLMRLRKCILVIVFLSLHFWPKSWCQVYLSWVGNQELWRPQVRLQPDIQCLGRTRSRYAQPAFLLFPCIVYVNMSCSLIYSCTVRYKLMLLIRNQILYKSGPVVLGLKMHGNNLRPNPPLRSLLCPERQELADLQPRGVAL